MATEQVDPTDEMIQKIRRRLFLDPVLDSPEDIVRVEKNQEIIKLFIRMEYKCTKEKKEAVLEKCRSLFRRDYECGYVSCEAQEPIPETHPRPYPLVIPLAEKDPEEQEERINFKEIACLIQDQDCFLRGRFLRPVIIFKGKYVCRSRYPLLLKQIHKDPNTDESDSLKMAEIAVEFEEKKLFAKFDVDFLKSMGVTRICDLTDPNDCDFQGDITSSDTLKDLYREIKILKMPYPNEDLLCLETDALNTTKDYFKILLQLLIDGEDGFLLQTFDGSYTAALFTSLLRISLWADGVIHKSLNTEEMAYLTLSYDWYLFGFCMKDSGVFELEMLGHFISLLPLIATNEFSITRMYEDLPPDKKTPIILPRSICSSREELLNVLCDILLKSFKKSMKYITSFRDSIAKSALKMKY